MSKKHKEQEQAQARRLGRRQRRMLEPPPVPVSGKRKPHHTGPHQRIARQLCTTWTADPNTRCLGRCTCHALTIDECRCGHACTLRLDEHRPTTKMKPKWTAGHAYDGMIGSPYRPEVHGCGSSGGATYGNSLRQPHQSELKVTRWW